MSRCVFQSIAGEWGEDRRNVLCKRVNYSSLLPFLSCQFMPACAWKAVKNFIHIAVVVSMSLPRSGDPKATLLDTRVFNRGLGRACSLAVHQFLFCYITSFSYVDAKQTAGKQEQEVLSPQCTFTFNGLGQNLDSVSELRYLCLQLVVRSTVGGSNIMNNFIVPIPGPRFRCNKFAYLNASLFKRAFKERFTGAIFLDMNWDWICRSGNGPFP